MPNKTFFWFFLPTGLAMILFIGLPIISTGIQSFYAQHDQVVKEVKKCDPFGCCLLYTSPSPRDPKTSRMPSSA